MQVLLLCDGGGSMGVGRGARGGAGGGGAGGAGCGVGGAGRVGGRFGGGQLAAAQVEGVRLAAPRADHDLQPVIDLVSERRPDVVHVDSYEAPARLRELGELVLSNVEDGSFGRRTADVVVDPTLGAELVARPDDGSTATCLLLRGSRYAPMRQRVIDARRMSKAIGEVARRVLVVMGGTDPVGLAPAAVKLLASTGLALEVTVIAVGENAERARVAAHGSALSLSILAPVDDLAAMMSGQDLVVSAAGTSVWELCCIGVPMALIRAVDNQRDGYDRAVAAGAAAGPGGPEPVEQGGPGSLRGADGLRRVLADSPKPADVELAGRPGVGRGA